MNKNTEINISIFLPALTEFEDNRAVSEAMMAVKSDSQLYGCRLPLGDSGEYAIVITDRELSIEEATEFYNDIMEYHQVKDGLSDEEIIMRDEEVKTKWLNGNFNWWCLGAGKVSI